jgi:hypothetical protein
MLPRDQVTDRCIQHHMDLGKFSSQVDNGSITIMPGCVFVKMLREMGFFSKIISHIPVDRILGNKQNAATLY